MFPNIGKTIIELTKSGVAQNITTALGIQLIVSVIVSCLICVLCIATFKVFRISNIISLIIFGRK